MVRQRWFQELAAEGLAGACPGQARFLLWTLRNSRGKEYGLERVCPYCFQFLLPDSHRVRLKPKMKATPQIEKILKREAKNHRLNMKQTKLLKKYRESRSVLAVTATSDYCYLLYELGFLHLSEYCCLQEVFQNQTTQLVTCKSCNKTTRRYGKSRDFLATMAQNSGTPSIKSTLRTSGVKTQSANNVTPINCSRLGSKGNSPSSFPRTRVSGHAATSSASSSASRTPRNSKFHFSKLKRMLDLEEKDKSQKADLKTFLTLL